MRQRLSSVACVTAADRNVRIEPHMLRFLRRAMRDSLFRSTSIEHTLKQWNSVRRGERLYISPYRGQADLTVDTYLPYETNILMQYLSEKLQVEEKCSSRPTLHRSARFWIRFRRSTTSRICRRIRFCMSLSAEKCPDSCFLAGYEV